MSIGKSLVQSSLIVLLFAGVVPGQGVAAMSARDHALILNHDLAVELIPPSHELVARDQVELDIFHHPQDIIPLCVTCSSNS